jgi:hypothetical protein
MLLLINFIKCKSFSKFIDEYIELIEYLENKYPSFKDDINKDFWILRIIKEHYQILLSLSDFLPNEDKDLFNEYINRVERQSLILQKITYEYTIKDLRLTEEQRNYFLKFVESMSEEDKKYNVCGECGKRLNIKFINEAYLKDTGRCSICGMIDEVINPKISNEVMRQEISPIAYNNSGGIRVPNMRE